MLIVTYFTLVFTIGRCLNDQSFVTKKVCVGEEVTLTCERNSQLSGILFWIKVVSGNFPDILAVTYTFDNGLVVNKSHRIRAKKEPETFVLHITKTQLSDAAFYCCVQLDELQTTFVTKIFLKVTELEPDITAITQDFPSDPVQPGHSVSLQCSVLSENKTCPGGHSVFWFRAGSDESHPRVIYTHGNSDEICERNPDAGSPQRCVYNYSKNVSSSDAGTYFCAVATCGKILFGNGTKLDIEASNISSRDCQKASSVLWLLGAALAISLVIIALLSYTIKTNKCICSNAAGLQTQAATTTGDQQSQQTDEDSLVYAVPNFIRGKPGKGLKRGRNSAEGESIYSHVVFSGQDP